MMPFIPAKDYDNLLIQARAMSRIIEGLERQSVVNAGKIEKLNAELTHLDPEEIKSQRQANEILTNEVEDLRRQVDALTRATSTEDGEVCPGEKITLTAKQLK